MLLQMKTFRQVGMMTVKTKISKMRIDMRTCKELFNHMFKKKMTDKKFADTHRMSNLPTFPGARSWRRRRLQGDAGGLPHSGGEV